MPTWIVHSLRALYMMYKESFSSGHHLHIWFACVLASNRDALLQEVINELKNTNKNTIDRSEIDSAAAVRNSWWHGWGIRKVSRGWMYNNAGRDAIELSLRSGRVFRIGTDQPDELLEAVTA